jgi:PAS domain S-box-containing protein
LAAARSGDSATAYQLEYRIQLPNGPLRWVRERGFPLLGDGNQVQRLIGIVSDITASHDAREELRRLNQSLEERIAERTERMRMMIESSAEAVITINSQGFIEEWNGAAERVFGWIRSDAVGQRLSELIIPHRYRVAHESGMQRFLAGGESNILNETIELVALRSSGEEFPVELSVWPVRCAEGYLFSAFLRDITERKRALLQEKQRSDQALLFRQVLYDLARVDKADYARALLHILRTAAQTLGLARVMFARFETTRDGVILRSEVLYRAASDDTQAESELGVFAMAEYPRYFAALVSNRPVIANDACTNPATAEFRDHYLIPLGITSMLDVPVWMDGKVVAVVCCEHVGPARDWSPETVGFALSVGNLVALTLEAANRARTEADLREAEADVRMALAREQELSELKSRFVAMASHEFRTPLTAILSSVELLERYGDRLTPDNKTELIGMIKNAIKNMTQMLEEVLFIGKGDTGHLQFNPELTDTDAFCEQLLRELRAGIGQDHRIEFARSDDSSPVRVDSHLLRQILVNLLSNAIKFSPQGSSVTLTQTRRPDAIVFEVTDQGMGIPPEDQPNLFNTFHRARNVNNIQGTGLGLAIVKQCADLHGGLITYTSVLGQGTRFTVKIPLAGESE